MAEPFVMNTRFRTESTGESSYGLRLKVVPRGSPVSCTFGVSSDPASLGPAQQIAMQRLIVTPARRSGPFDGSNILDDSIASQFTGLSVSQCPTLPSCPRGSS